MGELVASAVLAQVARFLRDLPPQQLADLAAGRARLAVVSAADAAGGAPAIAAALPCPAEQILQRLRGCPNRFEAQHYLDGLALSAAALRVLAREGGVAVAAKASKAALRDALVQWTVGRRVDSSALSQPQYPRGY